MDSGQILKFTLISYAAAAFFSVGQGFAFLGNNKQKIVQLILIFLVMAIFYSALFRAGSVYDRIEVSLIWTSLLAMGYRFGRKISRPKSSPVSET